MNLTEINTLIQDEFNDTNNLILAELKSDVALISQIGHYLVSNGGKRIRPLLTLLIAKAIGYKGKDHVLVAAIIEFIHSATLLHDDVVDESDMRRGKPSANAAFTNAASVLTGDFLYSRAFQMMVQTQNMTVLDIMAETTNKISEGEVLQLLNCKDPTVGEDRYFQVIYHKTGKLFEAACELSAVIHGSDQAMRDTLRSYGKYIGNAFQIIDDVLDYTGDEETIGKKLGDDLREGNPTLPLIYAMKHAPEAEAKKVYDAIKNGDDTHFAKIRETVQTCGAIEYCKTLSKTEAEKAKDSIKALPESDAKTAMLSLCDIAANRDS